MAKKLLELCADLVQEYIAANPLDLSNTQKLLIRVYNTLQAIRQVEDQGGLIDALSQAAPEEPKPAAGPPVGPAESIRDDHVVCLECGGTFLQLTANHLKTHGLTHLEYKKKWGFRQQDAPAARRTTENRRVQTKEGGLPKGLQDHQRRRKRSKGQ